LKIGLALGGGAARGIAHIGVLKYLEDRGVVPCCVAGTSAGSIVGSLYCSGKTPDELIKIAKSISWKDLVKITIPKKGLINSSLILDIVSEYLGEIDFKDLKIPLKVNAVDLLSGDEIVITEGSVAESVQASCAIPGIFTPVKKDKYFFVDGGLLDNVPVTTMLDEDLDYIIAVDVGSQKPFEKEPSSIFEILMQSFDIVRRHRDIPAHKHADVMIAPDLGDISLWDVTKTDILVNKGYKEAEEKLSGVDLGKKQGKFQKWLRNRKKNKKEQ